MIRKELHFCLCLLLTLTPCCFAAESDAVFDPSDGRLTLPLVHVGQSSYSAELQLTGSSPIRFELHSARPVSGLPHGVGASFSEGLVTLPTVQVAANDYSVTLRQVPSLNGKLTLELSGIKPKRMRAVHSGGNWGANFSITRQGEIAEGYFDYLRAMSVDWVGVSVAISVDDSMDRTVDRRYGDAPYTTYDDEVLRRILRSLRAHGLNVYLTLAFEIPHAEVADRPMRRWQIGNPHVPTDDPAIQIKAENWPWNPSHPEHASFVADFFRTYTEQAVFYARIAEEEGVRLYSLGTETHLLFRSRSGNFFTNNFRDELVSMVQQVRQVYKGAVTYDMSYQDLLYQPQEAPYLWKDLGLDVIGISAYFELTKDVPTAVLSQQYFEERWEEIFLNHLQPLAAANPGKAIVFTEFGYVDSLQAPAMASAGIGERSFADADQNGLDDGEEMQRNLYAGLFTIMEKYPTLLNGTFFWDTQMLDDTQWNESYHRIREFSFRQKLSEDLVRSTYASWK